MSFVTSSISTATVEGVYCCPLFNFSCRGRNRPDVVSHDTSIQIKMQTAKTKKGETKNRIKVKGGKRASKQEVESRRSPGVAGARVRRPIEMSAHQCAADDQFQPPHGAVGTRVIGGNLFIRDTVITNRVCSDGCGPTAISSRRFLSLSFAGWSNLHHSQPSNIG